MDPNDISGWKGLYEKIDKKLKTGTILFTIWMCLPGTSMFSQKHYNQWLFGATAGNPMYPNLRVLVDFNSGEFSNMADSAITTNFIGGMGAVCDSSGQLQLYTNGHLLYDGLHRQVPNGVDLNPSKYLNVTYQLQSCPNCYVFIPFNNNYYRLIHLGVGDSMGLSVNLQTMYVSTITGSLDSGYTLQEKNKIINEGFFEQFNIVKTGNGNDYWVVQPILQSDSIQFYYLSQDTYYLHHIQKISPDFPKGIECYAPASNNISRQGDKYARFNNACGLWLYDLDRCEGKLSNPREIPLPVHPLYPGASTEFSPSGRYLYFTSSTVVYQVDTEASILQADTVAVYDGTLNPFKTNFLMLALQPDGKIYLNSPNGVLSMHRIEYPDSAGISCQVQQNAIELAGMNAWVLHRYPNIWLGPAGCDSTNAVTTIAPSVHGLSIYPQPATSEATIVVNGGEGYPHARQVMVFSTTGQQIYEGILPAWSYIHRFHIQDWPSGIYTVVLVDRGQLTAVGRMSVVR